MKKWIALIAAILLFGSLSVALAADTDPLNVQVQKLYSTPSDKSNLVFNIPVEVRLLDVSDDANWFKVKISFSFGPLSYTYVGWTQLPVGQILAERSSPELETASTAPSQE